MKTAARTALLLASGSLLALGQPQAALSQPAPAAPTADTLNRTVLPIPPAPFQGKVEPDAAASTPDPPKPVRAPAGAPNVLLIMTDDVGFGASDAFGGPIPTPTFDALAAQGVKFNRFHTAAMCSPTRAALLTGRNQHNVGYGVVAEMASGFAGYNGQLPKDAASIAEILRQNGYSTAMFGKHHNVPPGQRSTAGPFDTWPTGLGFEYFFGFVQAETNQWTPALYENTKAVEPDYRDPKHLDSLLADHAVGWLRRHEAVAPDKPFFVYYASGTPHAPHQAPPEWIARFKGKFDQGWDKQREQTFARQKALGVIPRDAKLTPRPAGLPAWDSLSADQKKVYARMMEVYAATLAHDDHQIGRVIEELRAEQKLDNTLIIYIQGDNGASPEGTLQGSTDEYGVAANGVEESTPYLVSMMDKLGGPMAYNHYPVGWAWAMNTPFQWFKQVASHLGATRNGMVISWPGKTPEGGLRSQFSYVTDILPTVLEAARLPAPRSVNGVEQRPLDGVSLLYTLDAPAAPSRHHVQYFEHMANRAIYADGWMASTTPKRAPWVVVGGATKDPANDYHWELYDLDHDFSQSTDVAAKNPAKLAELKALWMSEARRNNVLPLDDRFLDRPRMFAAPGRTHYVFHVGDTRIPTPSAPRVDSRSFTLKARVEVPAAGAEGVLTTIGGRFGGWSLFLDGGRPTFAYALSQQDKDRAVVAAPDPLPPGPHEVTLDFDLAGKPGGPAQVRLSVDGQPVANGEVARTARLGITLDETFDVGADSGTPASEAYAARMPFAFTGKLEDVTVDLR